ncbi:MAG: hypothetical protein HY820_37695 [Acidobacteria bacterium]|nr:hypothetical protein [Acidobacteriota bacterium]
MQRLSAVLFSIVLLTAALHGQQYLISTIAGGAPPSLPARAVDVIIGTPSGVAADAAGNVYFTGLGYLFKLDPAGILHHIAGNGRSDPLGDGGPATEASIGVGGLACDAEGNLFLADNLNHRIRKINGNGTITTIAGGGGNELGTMSGLALASDGSLFVSDSINNIIRKITPEGAVLTVAGGGAESSEDTMPALEAKLASPSAIAADAEGNIYFADINARQRIRRLSPDGILTTIAGNGMDRHVEDGPAASAAIFDVGGIVTDRAGNIIFSEYNLWYRICSLGTCGVNVHRPGGSRGTASLPASPA